jgi:hypothetical protein
VVEGKKDEGATRRVMGAWTLGVVFGGRIVWKCLVQLSLSMSNDDSKEAATSESLAVRERAFQSRRP